MFEKKLKKNIIFYIESLKYRFLYLDLHCTQLFTQQKTIKMIAKVKINYRDMKGNSYDIIRIVNDLVTLRYITNKKEQIFIDFTLSELEILNKGNSTINKSK